QGFRPASPGLGPLALGNVVSCVTRAPPGAVVLQGSRDGRRANPLLPPDARTTCGAPGRPRRPSDVIGHSPSPLARLATKRGRLFGHAPRARRTPGGRKRRNILTGHHGG